VVRAVIEWSGYRPPRDWQPLAADAVLTAVRAGEHPLVSAATGTGKADLVGWLARAAVGRGPVVVSTPTQNLVRQLAATLEQWCPGRVGQYYADRKDVRAITVCCNASLPALAAHLRASGIAVRLMIVDEAHKSAPDSFVAAVEVLAPRVRVGVTATPYRTDRRSLGLFTRCVYRYSMADATRDGVLVPLRGHWWTGHGAVADDIDGVCLAMTADAIGPGVYDAVSIEDAEAFAGYLTARGRPSAAVHSLLPRAEGDRRIARLQSGELRSVVHVYMLTEGVDYPWLMWGCLRRPRGSIVQLTQQLGRFVRSYPGKDHADVYDPYDVRTLLKIPPDAVGVDLAAALDAAAELEATEPKEGEAPPVVMPPAVAVDELQQWARRALEALVASGVVVDPGCGPDRGGWASDRQVAQLAKLSAVARWLPEGPRLAVRAAIDHSSYLTSGQAADLTALLLAAADASGRARARHGTRWPAVWASIRRRLESMPAPPSEAVEALIVSAKTKA
jgi:hypothetical protein